MDTFGSVDPYALLLFEGFEYRSKTVKGSYKPEWNETFEFVCTDCSQTVKTNFVVQINDWDATNKDDEVGSFTIPASRMSEIVRARLGWEGEDTFKLQQEGKGVVGHDKEPSEVTLKMSVVEVPKAFGMLEMEEGAKGPRRINVTVVSAKHLPKVMIKFQFNFDKSQIMAVIKAHVSPTLSNRVSL
jgi:Ca2+-dependent lipid-binding protein